MPAIILELNLDCQHNNSNSITYVLVTVSGWGDIDITMVRSISLSRYLEFDRHQHFCRF